MRIGKFNDLVEDEETIDGRWELGDNSEVVYRRRGFRESVRLKAALVAAEPYTLVIGASFYQADQKIITRILKLSGSWRADDRNRITFSVTRKDGAEDVLTFEGSWQLGRCYEIIFSSENTALITKEKQVQQLIFKGVWDISEKNQLVFYVGADTNQTLRFRGAFQTKSLLAKEGQIRYQLGAEFRKGRRSQNLVFFGKWKLSSTLGLSFEMEYDEERKKSMNFGAEYRLRKDQSIAVVLKTREGRPLGAELVLTKDFLEGQGQAFVRLSKLLEDSRIEAGMKFYW